VRTISEFKTAVHHVSDLENVARGRFPLQQKRNVGNCQTKLTRAGDRVSLLSY